VTEAARLAIPLFLARVERIEFGGCKLTSALYLFRGSGGASGPGEAEVGRQDQAMAVNREAGIIPNYSVHSARTCVVISAG
jgi:hypothetical protein